MRVVFYPHFLRGEIKDEGIQYLSQPPLWDGVFFDDPFLCIYRIDFMNIYSI